MKNSSVLAFDCAGLGASISLKAAGIPYRKTLEQNRQAAELVSTIDNLITQAHLRYSDLSHIITTVGPGSFTGLRIGLATLHGVVLATNTPIKTLTSLEAMAWTVLHLPSHPEHFTIAMRAGKGELFAQEFTIQNHAPVAAGEIFLTPEGNETWPAPCYSNVTAPESPYYLAGPNTDILCDIVDHLPTTSLQEALPLYIRPPDAKLPN